MSNDSVIEKDGDLPIAHYFPDDNELSFWMFAMIGIGCIFIAFVAFSFFILCRTKSPTDRSCYSAVLNPER